MEPKELSPAMLQPQVTVVATLGELLDTLPMWDEEEMMLKSSKRLHRGLKEFTKELWVTLRCIDDTWRRHIVTDDDSVPAISLTWALAVLRSAPWSTQDRVAMAAREWQWSVAALKNSWAKLSRKAKKLRDTCRVATEAKTAKLKELQAQAARDGTAQEHRVELGQALGGEEGAEVVARTESPVRREVMVAASEATTATMERQWVWAALGLLERLVAACDEATAFPRELQRLLKDIETTLKDTSMFFRTVPEDLVAKAAEAVRLWEASARLAKDHLVGAVDDFINCYFTGGPAGPSPCEVAERCQRAIEDIPRLLRPPEHPQGVPRVSLLSTEPQELSPALLQPQVTVVATLGELLDTLPMWDEETLLESSKRLHRGLKEFTKELRATLQHTEDTWRHRIVTAADSDLVTSLSRALAVYKRTTQTTQGRVAMAASEWQRSVNVLVDSWAQLARKASELRDSWSKVATEALTTQAKELQDEAARDGTALERMGELGQALGGKEGAKVVAGPESPVRRKARVAASEGTTATMGRQRVEAALGPLECLVAACDKATAFPLELLRLLRDTEIALKGTKKKFPTGPKDLVAKVAEAERLWDANTRLAKDHLLGTIEDILDYYSKGGRARPCAHEVAKQCQRAIEDIPNLLQDDDVTAMTS